MKGSGQTYTRQFNQAGAFVYQCDIHGVGMRGTITVVAGGVGGETLLADVGSGVRQDSAGLLNIRLGMAAIASGMVMLTGAAWLARRLAVEEPPS